MLKSVDWIDPSGKYKVSDDGIIYRVYKTKIIPLKLSPRGNGYLGVRLNNKQYFVHRIVATAFLGLESNSNLQVNHINGNKTDNRVDNLELLTPKENVIHAYKERLNKSVLSLDTATFISEIPEPGSKNFGYKVWCAKLGISEKNAYRIRKLDRNYSKISDNRLTKILADDSVENKVYRTIVKHFYEKHPEFTKE